MTAAAKTRWGWRPACPVSVGIWLAVVVLAFPLVPGAQAHSPYETPPVMKVTDLAPAGLIVGQGYRVGEGDEAASALIANKNYSISALTALMTALERLGPILGRADVVALAATAANEDQARFLMGSAQMLAHHHEWVTPLATVMARGTVVGKTATGGLVVGAPVDYVVWTENVANFARRPDFAATSRDIWLTRRMSPRARHEFERIGWRVHEGSRQPSRTEEFAP